MGRGLLHLGAWAAATAVAVAVSWFGVHSVLRDTAYGPPRTLPLPVLSSAPPARPPATRRPKPPSARTPAAPGTAAARPGRTATAPPPGRSADPGDVHSYTVAGGQVVLALGADSASLVSATPEPSWRMQLWTAQPGWLRVTFTSASGSAASTVSCTWNGHPPTVQAYED